MSWQRALLILLVVFLTVVYYWLAALALRDLLRRPAVRGDNKVTWGLVIVCVPFFGALLYGYMGAASFLPRTPPSVPAIKAAARSITDRRPTNRGQNEL